MKKHSYDMATKEGELVNKRKTIVDMTTRLGAVEKVMEDTKAQLTEVIEQRDYHEKEFERDLTEQMILKEKLQNTIERNA